ncbi:YadA-like family protein [Acinetobacter kanungonis]|uniref:YadA-like family protein n=1 Tax=Acinetobacter kanungonis TaxID=2699469 RepID=UPI002E29A3F4|nr:YadA-like family protein [Acinetobacter kanungonis]
MNNNLTQTRSDLTSLDDQVNNAATGLTTKVSQSDFDVLNNQVNDANTGLDTKASQSDFNTLNNQVNDVNTGLGSKASEADLNTLKNQTWSLQTNGGSTTTVKATDTINFIDGRNIAVTNTGTNISIATIDNPEFNTVKIGDSSNSTTLSSGPNGLDIGGDKLTNLADGNIAAGSTDAVTGGQINDLLFQSGQGIKYFHTNSTLADSEATGLNSVAIGPIAKSQGESSIAVGHFSNATGLNSIAVGNTANALNDYSIAFGKETGALGTNSTSIGNGGQSRTLTPTYNVSNTQIVAINGIPVTATSTDISSITEINGVAVTPAQVTQFVSAIQNGANMAVGDKSVSLGASTLAGGPSSIAVGNTALATGSNSNAIGNGANAAGNNSNAIGTSASAATNATALGNAAAAGGSASVAVGNQAVSGGAHSVAVGDGAKASVADGVSIGNDAGVGSIGSGTVDRNGHIAIGANSGQNIAGNQSIAIGVGAGSNATVNTTSSDYNIALGTDAGSNLSGNQNISIGFGSNKDRNETIQSSVALGAATFTESLAVAVGTRANAAQGGIALGYDSSVIGTSGVAIGLDSVASQSDVALGSGSIAQNNSLGNGYITNVSGGVGGFNIVSVGNDNEQRRITNVADGSNLQDAVTVNQIKALQSDIIRVMGATDSTGNPATIDSNGKLPLIKVNVIDPSTGNTSQLPTTIQDAFNLLGSGQIGGIVPDAVLYNSDKSVVNLVGTDGTIIRNVKADDNDLTSAVNVGQLKAAVEEAGPQYFSVKTGDINNKNNTGASGDNSLAIGPSASTSTLAVGSIALGNNVIAARERAVAIGAGAGAVGASSISIGDSSIATGTNNIAMGKSAESRGEDTIVIGNGSEADGTKSNYAVVVGSDSEVNTADQGIAIGRQALAQGDNGTAIGYQAKVSGAQGVALGRFANASAEDAMAFGDNSKASGVSSTSIGSDANSTAQDGLAIGSQSKSFAAKATAIGQNAESSGENAIAAGTNSVSRARDATAIGNNATSNGVNAIALGKQSNANALNSVAIGTSSSALLEDAVAIGNSASVTAKGASVFGKSATASHENAVVLGNNSVSAAYVATPSTIINGKTYNFAGAPTTSSSVSVGDVGSERTIVNVAAGRVSAASTDAINGSQLYQTNQAITDLADTALSFAGDTGTKIDRKLGEQLNVKGGATGVLTDNNIGVVADGTDTLQLKLAKDVDLSAQGSLTVGTSKVTDGQVEIKDSANNSYMSTSTQTVISSGTSSNISNASSINLSNASNNVLLSGTSGTLTGLTNKTLTEADFATVGRAATEEQLKLVNDVAQNANKGWNLTTNKDVSSTTNVAPDATVDFSNSDNNLLISNIGADIDLKLAEVVNVGGLSGGATIAINGKNGTITGLTNTTFDPINYVSGRAATEDQLATPLTFVGDNAGVNVDRRLGQRLSIVGGESVAANLTDNNIGVVADSTDNKLTIKLAKDIKLDSVNAGGTVIDSKGLTFVNSSGGAVPNSPSVTVTGINAGTNKITNVAAGDITDSSMDAVNGSQIKQIIDKGFTVSANADTGAKDTIALGENVDFNATDSNIKIINTGNNGITFGLEPVVKIGPATGGNPVIVNGNTGTVTGLTNKTTISSDFATAGRAATEEQLKEMQTGLNNAGFALSAEDGNTITKPLGESIEVIGADSNISTKVSGGKVQVELSKNIDLTRAGSLTVGKSKVTDGKVELKDGNKTNTSTIDGTLVSDGTNSSLIGAGSINLGNGLYQTQMGPTQIIVGGANPVKVNGSTGTIGGLTNKTFDPNNYVSGQAATEDQLKSLSDSVQNSNKGWLLTTNGSKSPNVVDSTSIVDFSSKKGNIEFGLAGTDVTVELADDINVNSVTAGDAVINSDGLTIKGGPSVTKNGIDAAGNKVTNVAEGSIAQYSKDAVNGSQIHDIIGDGAFQGGDGNTIVNIGGTGATNINDAISSINQKAGQHSTVVSGQNITVTETKNSAGGKEFVVATADDVKFNSVTSNTVTANNVKVGDVAIDQNGINAGNKKVTNVASGEVSSTSKDAVNGSQLHTSNQYITTSLGGGAKYENGQFTAPTYNVNKGTYHNVGDALGALNQADIDLGDRITNLGDRIEQVFYNTNGRIDDVEKKANAGIAAAMAMEGAPFVAGKFTYAAGAAYHGGENAVGVTLRKTADNGRWSFTGGMAAASQGDPSVRIGFSGVLD